MKKIIIAFTILSCLQPSARVHAQAPIVDGILHLIKDALGVMLAISVVKNLESASSANTTFVNTIKKELGISYPIQIKKMNQYLISRVGYENAFVIPGGYMVISEDWFNSLPDDEKRALIGHELMHMKKLHAYKTFIASTFLSSTVFFGPALGAASGWISATTKSFLENRNIVSLLILTETLLLLALSRKHEREADIESAKMLKSAQGGVNLLKRMLNSQQFLNHLPKMPYLLLSHPPLEERIAYLQELAAQQN